MLLFKRHKKDKIASRNKQVDALFQHWEKAKRRVACYLQKESELMSLKSKRIIVACFFLFFSACSIGLVLTTFIGNKESMVRIKQLPKLLSSKHKARTTIKADSVILYEDYKRIELFKAYLLQLKDDPTNKIKFDSIMRERPHLLDSITLFEKMYLSQ